jgi:hypothetical protein
MGTAISWTDETWNCVTGCSRISEGCRNCYAERLSLERGWSAAPWTAANAAERPRAAGAPPQAVPLEGAAARASRVRQRLDDRAHAGTLSGRALSRGGRAAGSPTNRLPTSPRARSQTVGGETWAPLGDSWQDTGKAAGVACSAAGPVCGGLSHPTSPCLYPARVSFLPLTFRGCLESQPGFAASKVRFGRLSAWVAWGPSVT